MSTLHKSHSDPSAPSCIVVGTENRDLYILDAAAFTFLLRVSLIIVTTLLLLNQMTLPAVPVFLSIAGIYDVDYSISIACRNGCVYTIKKYKSCCFIKFLSEFTFKEIFHLTCHHFLVCLYLLKQLV